MTPNDAYETLERALEDRPHPFRSVLRFVVYGVLLLAAVVMLWALFNGDERDIGTVAALVARR